MDDTCMNCKKYEEDCICWSCENCKKKFKQFLKDYEDEFCSFACSQEYKTKDFCMYCAEYNCIVCKAKLTAK